MKNINYIISIICVIFIIIMVTLILSNKNQKPTYINNLIQSAASTNTDNISNVSFIPTKVALKDDNDNPGAIKLIDFYFPAGTILFWSSNIIPDGWESINLSTNIWAGRIPIARSDSTSANSKYNVVGAMGGSATPTPLPPYFTMGYIIKKSIEFIDT